MPELKPGIGVVLNQRASLVAEAQAKLVDYIGDKFLALLRVAKMQEQLLRIEGIIAQFIARLEVPVDPVRPIVETVFPSGLQGSGGVEGAAVQQGRELRLCLALAAARKALPEIEIHIERALLHVDPVQANDIDPGIDNALNPIVPVTEGDDMAFFAFRGEIDCVGSINADQLKRRGDEPPKMEIAEANGARNVAAGVEVQ